MSRINGGSKYTPGYALSFTQLWALARIGESMYWRGKVVNAQCIMGQTLRTLMAATDEGKILKAHLKRDPEIDGVQQHYGVHNGQQ